MQDLPRVRNIHLSAPENYAIISKKNYGFVSCKKYACNAFHKLKKIAVDAVFNSDLFSITIM